ncbi:hypothetical protein [Colwellia sp. BRX10-4]|jgi:hypothetical protein|uniref:hypothetical protein n=1 Tax=Colwellia sp. BRX10-4 TaxID=2759843 RepID=UPI0015F4F7BA|nr:hypothetical protein [Colwellia sp. BRX10-4]MBA6398918.1 hypothetical protein [Colwellia sp. BRX10-4]
MPATPKFHEKFIKFSPTLSEQLLSLRKKAKAPKPVNFFISTYKSVHRQSTCLFEHLEAITSRMNSIDLKQFQLLGFDAFKDREFWQRFERWGVISRKVDELILKSNAKVHIALFGLLKQHFDNELLIAPYEILIPNSISKIKNTYDFSTIYSFPQTITNEIKSFIEKVLQQKSSERSNQDADTILKNISGFLYCLERSLNTEEISCAVTNGISLDGILKSGTYCSTIKYNIKEKIKVKQFEHMLRYHSPEVHGTRRTTLLRNMEEALEFIESLSATLKKQIESFLTANKNDTKKHFRSRIMRFIRLFYLLKDNLDNSQLTELKDNGIKSFLLNNAEVWKIYLSLVKNEARSQTQIYELRSQVNLLLNHVLGRSVNLNEYIIYMFSYPHNSVHGEFQFQSQKYIHDNYPALFEDLKVLHSLELERVDAFKRQVITVKNNFTAFLIAIESNDDCLSANQKELLATNGLEGMVKNNNNIHKALRQHIQHKCKMSELDLDYGKIQQNAINQLLDKVGLAQTISYPVSQMKRRHHVEKRSSNNFYSIKEAVQLAFHIEKTLLLNKNLSHYQALALKIGRILLKTAWNMTPTFELTTEDIFYFDSPLGGKKTPAVRLFKRRANYSTQWYRYGLQAENIEDEGIEMGEKVRPVIQDLIDIRDNDSKPFRDSLPDDHPQKHRIMLYQSSKYDKPKTVDQSVFATLNELLVGQGCEVSFSTQRIRKGGLNYIYRKVSSDFKKYKKAGQHSFEVFLNYYLKNESEKSKKTLSNAINIMGDYFHGRELSEDIIILTDVPSNSRQTPNGSCIAGQSSEAAKQYDSSNYKLHKDNDTNTTLCADFNACLWCPFFRLVADDDHVWRLLSYKVVVIDKMKAAIVDQELALEQKTYITALSERVDMILKNVAKITPSAPSDGRILLKKYGIHPDWDLVLGNEEFTL